MSSTLIVRYACLLTSEVYVKKTHPDGKQSQMPILSQQLDMDL